MRFTDTTPRFERKLKIFSVHHPDLVLKVKQIMKAIVIDYRHPSLKTHRLSGNLKKCYASSITYQFRVVFVVEKDSICFLDIGDHDVYR